MLQILENLEDIDPFSLLQIEKKEQFLKKILTLNQFHLNNCIEFKKISNLFNSDRINEINNIEDLPYIPVRLFKEYELISVDKLLIKKTMTSSGTTGTVPSKINLDASTALNQTKVLSKILATFIGKKRLPMLIIDSKSVLKDRNSFSARGAGILGFSMFGYDVQYALDENMNLDINLVANFLEKHNGESILLFGFTFVVWEYFFSVLKRKNLKLPLENGILLHGGGWKKMIEQAVDNQTFRNSIKEVTGMDKVFNYYGLVEQTGSIFMECEAGYLHSSLFSEIIIRRVNDFSPASIGEEGLVQLISLLPYSYPGHSLLTEDLGVIIGIDNCSCGRKGKYFKINGRVKNAEVRGCSDAVNHA